MTYFRNFDKAYLLLVIPILRMTWPVLQYRVRSIIVVPFAIAWFLLEFGSSRRVVVPQRRLKTYYIGMTAMIALYILLPVFYGVYSAGDRLSFRLYSAVAMMTEFLLLTLAVQHSLVTGKIKELKFLFYVLCGSFLWLGVAAIRGGAKVAEVGGARLITSINQASRNTGVEYDYQIQDALSAGMGTAASTYISAFTVPLFIISSFYLHRRWQKVGCWVMAYMGWLNMKYGGLNTPLMIATVGLGLALMALSFRMRKGLVVMGVILAIMMTVFSFHPKIMSFMAQPLRIAATMAENLPQIKTRCLSMAEAVEGDMGTYAAVRYTLQQKSVHDFLNGSIILGAVGRGRENVGGGHSELLDCLARYGLLGASVIFMFWYFYLKYCNELARVSLGKKWLYMPYIYTGAWIFSSIPNPALLGAPIMMLFIPGLALFSKDFYERWGMR